MTLLATRVKALTGLILLLALLALGILARTTRVTSYDLHLDLAVRAHRFGLASGLFEALTAAASEVVGLGLLGAAALLLLVRRRRFDAVRLVLMAGAAWTLALVVKHVVARPRPPAFLALVRPDPSGSFPSGHDTTACLVVVIALFATVGLGLRLRAAVVGLAVLFAVGVGASRVYLGDHYPTDVLGSWLVVAAAALLVWAATDLRPVRRIPLLRAPEPLPAY
ncbi:phosphatase PAP2 family protein [Amnibacterium sp. CER49]|uniref:phosphatase PAP2 family protein n=1 Tax=Amnibacterium sp. CER49 TaxID=3039161 RepID=UPI0024481752|nr:phosphatase PAP2 family protein [Amnibacterium sp. CER49]MDH2443491.1 phosphatase PAP2 family protein [Amnibacterium sp. CER49]